MLNRCTGPNAQIILSWAIFVLCVIGWPVSVLTFARDEPPAVLSLSWAALILGAVNTLITAYASRKVSDVKDNQEQDTAAQGEP